MTRTLSIRIEQCTGCQSCMLACSLAKEGTHSLSRSRIQVSRDEENADFRPQVCIQCEAKFCIAACPVSALETNEITGAVIVNKTVCTGCRLCATACPHGGIQFDTGSHSPLICDLCDGTPACIETCRFPEAIQFIEEG